MEHLKPYDTFTSINEQVNANAALSILKGNLKGSGNNIFSSGDSASGSTASGGTSSVSNVEIKPSRNDEAACTNNDCWTFFGKEGFWNGVNTIGGKKVPEIKTARTKGLFTITYKGTPAGFLLKHAKGGKQDTIHQLLNVLTLELNPYLKENKLKPEVSKIKMDMSGSNLSVSVPLIPAPSGAIYEISRRGGLGHAGDYSGIEKYKSYPGYEEAIKKSANLTEKFVTYINK